MTKERTNAAGQVGSRMEATSDAQDSVRAARAQTELIEILARLVLASVEREAGGHDRGGEQAKQRKGTTRGAP